MSSIKINNDKTAVLNRIQSFTSPNPIVFFLANRPSLQ